MATIANCDFCGKKTEVVGTHYGSGFGYTRLICSDCKKELGAKSIKEEEAEKVSDLNKKLKETIETFIKENNLSCDKCSNMINGKCKSKLYCIVGEKIGLYVNYKGE